MQIKMSSYIQQCVNSTQEYKNRLSKAEKYLNDNNISYNKHEDMILIESKMNTEQYIKFFEFLYGKDSVK